VLSRSIQLVDVEARRLPYIIERCGNGSPMSLLIIELYCGNDEVDADSGLNKGLQEGTDDDDDDEAVVVVVVVVAVVGSDDERSTNDTVVAGIASG